MARSARPAEREQRYETADLAAYHNVVRERRGGANASVALLGLKTFETIDLLERVEAGFPFRMFERFQRNLGLATEELADLVGIKLRTLARRREEGRLTSEESDRLLRVSRVLAKAIDLFEGDMEAVRAWLAEPARALGNRTPQAVAATELGAREVENLIGRLEHGVYS